VGETGRVFELKDAPLAAERLEGCLSLKVLFEPEVYLSLKMLL
jgi:hypothetical protein